MEKGRVRGLMSASRPTSRFHRWVGQDLVGWGDSIRRLTWFLGDSIGLWTAGEAADLGGVPRGAALENARGVFGEGAQPVQGAQQCRRGRDQAPAACGRHHAAGGPPPSDLPSDPPAQTPPQTLPQTSPQTPAQTQWPRDVFVGLAALSSIGERIEFSSDTIRLNKVLTVRSTSVDPACDWLPLPAYTLSLSVRTSMGTAAYAPEHQALVWKIKTFPGGKEYVLRAKFTLPTVSNTEEQAEAKPPIQVKFEIPYFTVSGIQVRYLKIIEKSGYQALPWVRYITVSGNYEIRMS
eukprot:1189859-Prorocentrum_minimum.AAC.3